MHDIFLSYSRQDTQIMKRVKSSFTGAGFEVWTDEKIELGTDDWQITVEDAIENTKVLVCICSPDAKSSKWVRAEIENAEDRNKKVYLILARGDKLASIPFRYGTKQYTNILNPLKYNEEISKLIATLQRELGKPIHDVGSLQNIPTNTSIKNQIEEIARHISFLKEKLDENEYHRSSIDESQLGDEDSELEQLLAELEHDCEILNLELDRSEWELDLLKSTEFLSTPFEWSHISAGSVWLKTGGYVSIDKDEFYVEKFLIGKYPITNKQFSQFMLSGGYKEKKYWSEEAWEIVLLDKLQNPRYWNDVDFNSHDNPVVGVSWFEANAFCKWLSEVTDYNISLPTEQQWQQAAQGSLLEINHNNEYPWGNIWDATLCNNNTIPEKSLGKTSKVQTYENRNISDCGVVDMIGNTWEWCSTTYEQGNNPVDNLNHPVIRGGSWFDDKVDYFSVKHRSWIHRTARGNNIGFRICVT